MSSYNEFAFYYDLLTENADYKVRSDYISNLFYKNKGSGKKMLDLACGTGSLSKIFFDNGFDVTGVDLSNDMLTVADSKCMGKVNFLCADMTALRLNEKFDFCLCSLDSINHLTDIDDVKKCFDCVYNLLKDGGIFIFDVNTVYKHNHILADKTFAFDYDDFFLCWDNELEKDNLVRIMIDIFSFNGKSYDRYSEEFYEKAYTVDELKSLLSDFEIKGIYDELTQNPPNDYSERIYFVAKRN